jgi:hypothetical protein
MRITKGTHFTRTHNKKHLVRVSELGAKNTIKTDTLQVLNKNRPTPSLHKNRTTPSLAILATNLRLHH